MLEKRRERLHKLQSSTASPDGIDDNASRITEQDFFNRPTLAFPNGIKIKQIELKKA